MTDAKRLDGLLHGATPLPWKPFACTDMPVRGKVGCVAQEDGPGAVGFGMNGADAALIVYAVNHLPAYLAAVEALERLVDVLGPAAITWTDPVPTDSAFALTDARAALARLRDEVPA